MLAISSMLIFLGSMSFYLLQIDLTNDKRLAAQKKELSQVVGTGEMQQNTTQSM